ncbi:MAG: hypothetical protein ABH851_01060 [Methanobacteriota archaeon]
MKKARHKIFDDLDKLQRLKIDKERGLPGKMCTVYTPIKECVGGKCIWYDTGDGSCWVLNPKPKKARI